MYKNYEKSKIKNIIYKSIKSILKNKIYLSKFLNLITDL
jgi:hypothetical protein